MKKCLLNYIKFLLILMTLLIFSACGKPQNITSQIEIVQHSMTVQNFSGNQPSSIAVISGIAKNTSNQILERAIIIGTFYDEKGNVIDRASSTVNNIKPGETWNFSIQSKGTEAWKIVRYSLETK